MYCVEPKQHSLPLGKWRKGVGFPAYLKSKCSRRTKSATPKRRQLKRRAFGAANNFFMFELLEARYLLSANQFTSYQYYQWDNEVMGGLVGTDVDQWAFGDTNSTLRSSSTALTATELTPSPKIDPC